MKNFFSYDHTDNDEKTDFDPNPYLTARASESVREKMHHAFDSVNAEPEKRPPTAEESALKKKSRTCWIIEIVSLVAALAVFALQGEEANVPLSIVQFALLIVSVAATFIARRAGQKLTTVEYGDMQVDYEGAFAILTEAAKEAADELGVPSVSSMDILPRHYKMVNGEAVIIDKRGRFDNLSVTPFLKDHALCIATAQELYTIPCADIRGYRYIDEDFSIDCWLKEEEPDSERYREFSIRSAGFTAKKCRGYYAVNIADAYEILIPCYDWSIFSDLLPIRELP